MKVSLYSILFFLLSFQGFTLQAQYDAQRITTKSFPMTNDGELTLENKYGDVIIGGWDKDSIQIKVDIQVKKKSKSDAQELLDRISMKTTVFGRYIAVTTEIEEKGDSFLDKLFNELNPLDFDKSDVDINYEIFIPTNADIELTNSFGDLVLLDWTGKLKVDLRHGDLKITEPLANANLEVSFGTIHVRNLDKAFIELKNGKLKLHESQDLKLNSSGSELDLGVIGFLDLNSNKDEIQLEEVHHIKGRIRYSTAFINKVAKEIFLDLTLADIRVSKISNPDCSIYIKENNSEVDLNISGLSLAVKADLVGGTLRLPASTSNVDTQVLDEKNKIRKVTASYGGTSGGKFTLDGRKGYVILREL